MLTFVNFLGGRTYDLANQADLWFLPPYDHLSANHKKIVVIDILLALATSSLLLYHQNIALLFLQQGTGLENNVSLLHCQALYIS